MASRDEQLKLMTVSPQPPGPPRETPVLVDDLRSGVLSLFLANLVVAGPRLVDLEPLSPEQQRPMACRAMRARFRRLPVEPSFSPSFSLPTAGPLPSALRGQRMQAC